MVICSLQMSILHAQYINLLSILFANAKTFGAVPMPEAIAVAIFIAIAVPDAVANAWADVDVVADANL